MPGKLDGTIIGDNIDVCYMTGENPFSHTKAYKMEWSLCKLAVGKICPTSIPMWDKRN